MSNESSSNSWRKQLNKGLFSEFKNTARKPSKFSISFEPTNLGALFIRRKYLTGSQTVCF